MQRRTVKKSRNRERPLIEGQGGAINFSVLTHLSGDDLSLTIIMRPFDDFPIELKKPENSHTSEGWGWYLSIHRPQL